jgi:hypothetical protein
MIRLRPAIRLTIHGALAAALISTASIAFAQTEDRAPVAMKSSGKMRQDKRGSESWTYAQPRDVFTKYRTVIVEPTTVYTGPDSQFDGDMSAAERAKFAAILTDALRSELAKSFPSPARAQADTLRLKVTLLGAEKTKGGLATATRVTPIGFGLSAVKSALGKGGSLTGSVLVAVELYDARTNELLLAAVRRRSPDALDIPATLGTEETVKAVAREFADTARKRLEDLTQLPKQ